MFTHLLVIFLFISQVLLVSVDVWLSHMVRESREEQKNEMNLVIYGGILGSAVFFCLLRAFLFYHVSLRSSEQLHDRMTVAILKAPVLFFDTNPLGRILNRFSKDVGSMDEVLPTFFLAAIEFLLFTIFATFLPALLNPWILLFIAPFTIGCIYIVRYYLISTRELKRLESIYCSPVYSHISETLNGLDSIRSRRRQEDFILEFYR